MRGRKPKPVELRVLHGSAAERARAGVPMPRRKLPRCPDFLTEQQAKIWRQTAGELYDAGLLTELDRDALAAFCVAKSRWLDAEKIVADKGAVIKTTNGNLIQNPYLAIANRAQEQMTKLMAEFGMTPSARSRVRAEVQPDRRAAQMRERAPEPAGGDPRQVLKALG